jgi:septum formation protein
VTTGTILAADTVCILDGRIESQPTDRSDARRMLLAMRNARHVVITGVAILPMADLLPLVFFDQAWVTAGDLADARIDEYLDSGDWQGKAGAYNLTERQRAGWPIACDGDPATVMGLPMERLAPLLADLQSET